MYNGSLIWQCLKGLQQDPELRKETWGICYNLKYWYQHISSRSITDRAKTERECNEFLVEVFTHIYGEYLPFPIEGDSKLHHKSTNKWDNSKYGKARKELLDKMVDYISIKIGLFSAT